MIWGGNMEKILRLSFANMKKHKKQTILLTLLIVFCMAVTSAAIAGSIDMTGIFPRVADEYAVHKNALYIKEDYYNDSFIRLLREDERVTDIDRVRILFSTATKYLDNGKGVPADELDLIMNKFYRGRNVKDSDIDGSGLGLYIAMALMAKMNGELICSSKGKGLTVTLMILLS